MVVNEASLIVEQADQLADATSVATLAVSLYSAEVTQMAKMSDTEVRVMANKAMDI